MLSVNESRVFVVLSVINRIFGMAMLAYLIYSAFGSGNIISDGVATGILGILSSSSILFCRVASTELISRCLRGRDD